MLRAISALAQASRKTWHTPASCLITGMRRLSTTLRIRPGPPRGMRGRRSRSSRSSSRWLRGRWRARCRSRPRARRSRAPRSRSSPASAQVRANRLRAAAQDHGVARLHAQRRRVDRHVGPRLVDDRRSRRAGCACARRAGRSGRTRSSRPADGIGQRSDVAQPGEHVAPLGRREVEPVHHRLGHAVLRARREVLGVARRGSSRAALEPSAARSEPGVLLAGRELRRALRSGARAAREIVIRGQVLIEPLMRQVAWSSTRSSRWITSSPFE